MRTIWGSDVWGDIWEMKKSQPCDELREEHFRQVMYQVQSLSQKKEASVVGVNWKRKCGMRGGRQEPTHAGPAKPWMGVNFILKVMRGQWNILNTGEMHTLEEVVCIPLVNINIIMVISSKCVVFLHIVRYKSVFNVFHFTPQYFI